MTAGRVTEYELDPLELGVDRCDPDELRGGAAQTNAAALRNVLAGADGGHRFSGDPQRRQRNRSRGATPSLRDGLEQARKAIDSGAAAGRLDELVAFSQTGAPR